MRNPIPLFTVQMPPREELMPELERVLYSGYVGQGPKVEEFERALAEYVGTDQVLTVSSGTMALKLALRLANVRGGEVISTPMTCTATNWPVLDEGATLRWADIDPYTGLIDPDSVEAAVKTATNPRAILAVDWAGSPVDIDALRQIGQRHGIPVIEDAAHAFGSLYPLPDEDWPKVGSRADFTCFSFQAIKHITTVDGGALTTRSRSDLERGRLLRWYGIDRNGPRADFRCEADIPEWGYKGHMNDVTATIGLAQLAHVADVVWKHRSNAAFYCKQLSDSTGTFYVPTMVDGSACWLYTMLLPSQAARLRFMGFMQAKGVMVSQVHARNDKHSTLRWGGVTNPSAFLPGVDEFCERQVSIPVHHGITLEEREYIAECCKEFAARERE